MKFPLKDNDNHRARNLMHVGVSLRAQGRDGVLKSIDAWQMKNIYE